MIAAPGQTREKCARGLNAVLRISSQPDHGVLNVFRAQIGAVRCGRGSRDAVRTIGPGHNWS